jgi:spermidine/putrescine transport system ATP-binding protein
MSDRVAVMHRGRILQIGSPRDVYESPGSLFVANFVGQSNQLIGRVETVDAALCRVHVPGLPPIVARCQASLTVGARITLVIRPERLHLSREAPETRCDNVVSARIDKAIYNGSDMHYRLRFTDQIVWTARVANARGARTEFASEESVYVGWNAIDGMALIE